jgi:hypothetical protein
MSANAENIKVLINQKVRNYAVDSYKDMALNRILLMMTDLADSYGGGGGNGSVIVQATSANFTNTTDCPLTTLAGKNIAVFWNENQRFIEKDAIEWDDLPGGGFRVLIAGFDATAANFHFYVYVL